MITRCRKIAFLLALFASGFTLGAQAQLIDKKALSLAEARKALIAATEEARKGNVNAVIAVVDDGGFLVAYEKADKAGRISTDVAIGKARAAALFRRATAGLEEAVPKRPAMVTIPDQILLQGGMPITVDGEVIGGVGVSGGSPQQDEAIAAAGANVVGVKR